MARVNLKEVKQQCTVMNDAWFEGAPSAKFNGITQGEFSTAVGAAAAADSEVGDLEAELKMKRDVRDDLYYAINDRRSKIGLGVAGDPAYGNDSPLYGAMGFIRKSERASGLTRKKKTPVT